MTFRWYGSDRDSITLEQIRQIPNCTGIVGALYDVPVGEVWPLDKIMALKNEVEAAGLSLEVIESVNVHEDIKLGLPTRDQYIENYKQSLCNLGKAGIKVVCYNFMPIFDWLRTDLAKPRPDGANALSYTDREVANLTPEQLVKDMEARSNGYALPGWQPERLVELTHLFELYKDFTEDTLFANLKYFLECILPVAEEVDIKMAIHPDDPPWPVFGLPRIINSQKNLERFISLVDSPNNCLTLCTGSLGANCENDIPAIIRRFAGMGRVAFTHIRNVKYGEGRDFEEAAHWSGDGSLDMYDIVKAYHESGFDGYVRPDHGRMIWNEQAMPGYGLYDRALGIQYLTGLWEAIDRMTQKETNNA